MKKSKLTKIIRKEIETYHAAKEPKKEFIYPMYFKYKSSSLIVKFEALQKGMVVQKFQICRAGNYSVNWVAHTNTLVWEQVDFKEEVEVARYPVW